MEQNYQDPSSQQQQEMYAAEMRRQNQMRQQQQYQMMKNNNISQIANALSQIDPFDVIRDISKYGINTLPLEQQEKSWLVQLLIQIFNDTSASDFSSENWANAVRILTRAITATYNLQLIQMRQHSQMGGMFGGGMGMGGMPGMMGGGMMGGFNSFNPYDGMMGGMGFNQGFNQGFNPPPNNNGQNEEDKEKGLINQYKQMFFSRIYNVDPIIFINLLLQDNTYEVGRNASEQFENTLRILIANSLWRLQDDALQIIYCIISAIFNSEYYTRSGNGKNQNMGFNPGPGFSQPGMMGGSMPGMMGGIPGGMGMGMGMSGGMMGYGMGGFNSFNPYDGMMGGMPGGMGMGMSGGMMGNGGMMGGMGMPGGMGFNPGFMPPPMNGMGMMGGMPGGMGMGMPGNMMGGSNPFAGGGGGGSSGTVMW
jgi:hypothetical protein